MKWRLESGDTLIEVTFALSILSAILAGSMTVVVKSHTLSQTARERTQVSSEAQTQAELLRGFFENHKWDEFLNGATTPVSYSGVLSTDSGTSCHPTADIPTPHCFHMEVANTDSSTTEFVPVDGPASTTVPTSYIEIDATPDDPAKPKTLNYTINYGFEGQGGGQYSGRIDSLLAGMDPSLYSSTAGGAADFTNDSCDVPGGCGGPPPGGSYFWNRPFTNTSPPGQSVTGCLWNWGDGTTTSNTACNTGDIIVHTFPSMPTRPYPQDCWALATYTVTLKEFLTSGGTALKTNTANEPGCR